MRKRKLVLLSGPNRSGKSTCSRAWVGRIHELGDKMKLDAESAVGVCKPDKFFEDCKDEPNDLFNGHTPRHIWITYAEDFLKPLMGQDYYAKNAVSEIIDSGKDYLVSHINNPIEARCIVDGLKDKYDILHVKVERDGYPYADKGRVDFTLDGIRQIVLKNDKTLKDLGIAFYKATSCDF